jgi:hypothetical protein
MVEQRMAVQATSVACLLTVAIACTGQADRSANNNQNTKPAEQRLTDADAGHAPAEADADSGPPGIDHPPPVTVHYGNHQLVLHAYTWCYRNTCADGIPTRHPPRAYGAGHLLLEFPLRTWTVRATFTPIGLSRPSQTVTPQQTDAGLLLHPPTRFRAKAGIYDVTVSARGKGDLATIFRWVRPQSR